MFLLLCFQIVLSDDFSYTIGHGSEICYPSVQLGNKLVGENSGTWHVHQGITLALSQDGSTLAFGGPDESVFKGALYIFQRNETGLYTANGGKLVASDTYQGGNARQGCKVKMSNDGKTIITGGCNDKEDTGGVWVYVYNESTTNWVVQGAKLVGQPEANYQNQGSVIAINGSGNLFATSGWHALDSKNNNAGMVFIFQRNANLEWLQVGDPLVHWNESVTYGRFGRGLAFSNSGDLLAISAPYDGTGVVFLYNYPVNLSSRQTITPTGDVVMFGTTLELANDGKLLAVNGKIRSETNAIWIFTKSGSSWTQVFVIEDGYFDNGYGTGSFAISSDGNVIAIAGDSAYPEYANIGGVTIYVRPTSYALNNNNKWIKSGSKRLGTKISGEYAKQGFGVALSGDGQYMAIGGPTDGHITDGDDAWEIGGVWTFGTAGRWSGVTGSDGDCRLSDTTLTNRYYFKIFCSTNQYWISSAEDCFQNLQGPYTFERDTCTPLAFFGATDFLQVHCACPVGQYPDSGSQCQDLTPTAITLQGSTIISVNSISYISSANGILVKVKTNPVSDNNPSGIIALLKKTASDGDFTVVTTAQLNNGAFTYDTSLWSGLITIQVKYYGDRFRAPQTQEFKIFFYTAISISLGGGITQNAVSYLATNQNIVVKVATTPVSVDIPAGVISLSTTFTSVSKQLVNGQATHVISSQPNVWSGLITITVGYGDGTVTAKSQQFRMFFYTLPTTGTYLINKLKATKGAIVTYYNANVGKWNLNNGFNANPFKFNGWSPNKNLNYKCTQSLTLQNVATGKIIYKYIGIVGVSNISSTTHVTSIQNIVVINTTVVTGKIIAGQGTVLASFCPT